MARILSSFLLVTSCLHFSLFAQVKQVKSRARFLKFAEWQLTNREDRLAYFDLVIRALGEAENRSDLPLCAIGGQVFRPGASLIVDKNCRFKAPRCREGEQPCATWMSDQRICVAKSAKKSTAQACWEKLDKNRQGQVLNSLTDPYQHELWSGMNRAIDELCLRQEAEVCGQLANLSNSIRSRLPSEDRWLDRDERKIPESHGNEGRFKIPSWLSAFIPQAHAELVCSYDEASGTFSDGKGHKAHLIFGRHGIPVEIKKIFDLDAKDPGASAKDYRTLIENHEHSIAELRKNTDRAQRILNSQNIQWVGVEADNSIIGGGAEEGLIWQMERVAMRESQMKKLGLSAEEIRDALTIIYNPSVSALYRQYQAKGFRVRYVGLDNLRNVNDHADTVLESKSRLRQEIGKTKDIWNKQVWPDWVRDYKDKISQLESGDIEQASTLLSKLQVDPRTKEFSAEQTRVLQTVISGFNKSIETRAELAKEAKIDLDRRDAGMARDIWRELSHHGDGFFHVGISHKPGILTNLKTDCLNFSRSTSPVNPPSRGAGARD